MKRVTAPLVETSVAPPPPARRFLCSSCNQATLVPLAEGPLVARCESCAWSASAASQLIPVAPATLAQMVLGPGAAALARGLLFLVAAAALLALVLAPR